MHFTEVEKAAAVLYLKTEEVEDSFSAGEDTMVRRHMSLLRHELASCVTACGGELDRVDNNGIMAFFRRSASSEQSCRRAIDCGFRMLRTLELMGKSFDAEQDHLNLTGTVGITWGSSAITSDSAGASEVMGDCVEQAAELVSAAPPGKILVSETARSAGINQFHWNRFFLTPELTAWMPVEREDLPSVHPLAACVPLVGRDTEMKQLKTIYNSYLNGLNARPVAVVGKAGSGKTRLVSAFLSDIPKTEATVVKLRNMLHDQSPLGAWLPLMGADSFDPYSTVMSEIKTMRADGNLIIAVEDVHWADSASMKLLDQLSPAICDAGAFLIVTSRTELEGCLGASALKLCLTGLDEAAVCSMLTGMLGSPDGREGLKFTEFIMDRTAGNPQLVLELTLHAVETDIIGRNRDCSWYVSKNPYELVSRSEESYLLARFNMLEPREKFALQVAAVLGSGFEENLFQEVYYRLTRGSGMIALSRLQNTGFLSTAGNGIYTFANSAMLEACYGTISGTNKALIHKEAAETLLQNSGSEENSSLALTLSRHCIESGSGENAIPWLFSAMEQCIDAADLIRAETLSRELQNRVTTDSPLFVKLNYLDMRLFMVMGKFRLAMDIALNIRDRFTGCELALIHSCLGQARENMGLPLRDALEDYSAAIELAESSGDRNTAANCLGASGALYLSLGKPVKALDSLGRALKYRDSLDTMTLAKLHGNMGILMQRTGSLEDAMIHYSRTHELGKRCGNMNIEASALVYMGQVEINMGRKTEGIKKYSEALTIHRKAGNKRGECITLGNLGGQLARYGETENAIDTLEKAIKIGEEIGHTRGIMSFYLNIGLTYKIAGEYARAESYIRKSLEMMRDAGDKRALAVGHLNLSSLLAGMSRIHEAIDEARRSLRLACTVNALTTQARALGNLGWLMLKSDRFEMALNCFREAFNRSSLAEEHSVLAEHSIGECRALLELGRREEAEEKYKEVISLKNRFGIAADGINDLKELEEHLGIRDME